MVEGNGASMNGRDRVAVSQHAVYPEEEQAMKRRLRAPSPAFVVSLLALFVALGGTTYAATNLPKNSVGTKQLKKNAVTAAKIKNGAVTAAKINTKGLSVPAAIHATNATTATNATNAINALNATRATSATSATTATNAASAANANALGGVSASNYVQNNGDIFIQLGHSNWESFNNTDPIRITHYTPNQALRATSTGGWLFRIDAAIPSALYGKALAFAGVRICYSTNFGNEIAEVLVDRDTQTTDGTGSTKDVVLDTTIRTDAACRVYAPSAPIAISSADQYSVLVGALWSTANTELDLGNTTVILQPISATATAPKTAFESGKP